MHAGALDGPRDTDGNTWRAGDAATSAVRRACALSYSGRPHAPAPSPAMSLLRQTALLVLIVVAAFAMAFVMGGAR
jgi:hypothetical protein